MANSNSRLENDVMQAIRLDDPDFLRGIVEEVIKELLEAEMTEHIGAAPYERTDARRGQRNGYKPRTLRTRVGTLNLLVPQDRDGAFSTSLFARYQRNEKALVLALMEMYIKGVSTRKVASITEALCGTSFSKSLVSNLSGRLDAELKAWRSRPLSKHTYPYLLVDARYEDVRADTRVVSEGVLIVSAVRGDGKREIVAVDMADTESEATYNQLFVDLKRRGLSGVKLVVSDDHAGLKKAAKRHFQGASWQRCQVHFTRNAMGLVKRARRGELAADLRRIFTATDLIQAKDIAGHTVAKWQDISPAVAALVDEHIEECFQSFSFPESHRMRIRSTNGLERLNQEIKRRTRVVRIFPNREACLRLVSALAVEYSEEWTSGKIYLNMEELTEQKPPTHHESELAVVM
ncbi:MAG: IS256 family transposase [Actinomycetota bacterium]